MNKLTPKKTIDYIEVLQNLMQQHKIIVPGTLYTLLTACNIESILLYT